jgi:dodecin
MAVLKILELVGTSRQSWSDAAREAVNEAAKSLRGIETVEVVHSKAVVKNNQLSEYQVLVRIGFRVETSATSGGVVSRSAGSQNSGSKKKS